MQLLKCEEPREETSSLLVGVARIYRERTSSDNRRGMRMNDEPQKTPLEITCCQVHHVRADTFHFSHEPND
jgi:hypothetical protein